jgi:hypothetical protein
MKWNSVFCCIMICILIPTHATSQTHGDMPADTQFTGVAMSNEQEGLRLKKDIQEAYQQMEKSGTLSGRLSGNDITSVVMQHITVGSEFGRAEAILRGAGLKVYPRPGPKAEGTRPDRYNVYASSLTLVTGSVTLPNIEVRISLTPSSPESYDRVSAISARILLGSF